MDLPFRELVEKGTRIAFMHYIVRHFNTADRLRSGCSEVITSTIKSIENNPEIIAATKNMPEDTALEKIIRAAEKQLSEVINALEAKYKLVPQEQEK